MKSPFPKGAWHNNPGWLSIIGLAGVLALTPQTSHQSGVIKGRVEDSSALPLPRALVSVRNAQSNLIHTTTSSDSGEFLFPALEPGEYQLKVAMPGFTDFTRDNIKLSEGGSVALRVRLDLQPAPSHLGRAGKEFSMTIERHATSQTERALIDKAEHFPCPGGRWWKDNGTESRLPVCLSSEAVDYYRSLIQGYRARPHRPVTRIEHGPRVVTAEAFYVATANFDQHRGTWTVALSLEYSQSCGNVCGLVFLKTRVVTFDEAGRLVTVLGDGEDPHYSVQ